MTAANVELAESMLAAFNAGETERFWGIVSDGCVMRTDSAWPGGGTYRGREEIERFLAQFLEAFGRVHFQQRGEAQEIGERVLVHGRWLGRGAASGIETASVEFSIVVSVADRRVDGMHFFFSDRAAREFAAS